MIHKILTGQQYIKDFHSEVINAIVINSNIINALLKSFIINLPGRVYSTTVDILLFTSNGEYKAIDQLRDNNTTSYWNARIIDINSILSQYPYNKFPPIGSWEYLPMTSDEITRYLGNLDQYPRMLDSKDPHNNCMICGIYTNSLDNHIYKEHRTSYISYYNKYLNTDTNSNSGICLECKSNTKLLSYNKGFQLFCNRSCMMRYRNTHKILSVA